MEVLIKEEDCIKYLIEFEDGYLHLCGKRYFEEHKKVMDTIWDVCSQKIKLWHAKNN